VIRVHFWALEMYFFIRMSRQSLQPTKDSYPTTMKASFLGVKAAAA
jgi:hypothetical protein